MLIFAVWSTQMLANKNHLGTTCVACWFLRTFFGWHSINWNTSLLNSLLFEGTSWNYSLLRLSFCLIFVLCFVFAHIFLFVYLLFIFSVSLCVFSKIVSDQFPVKMLGGQSKPAIKMSGLFHTKKFLSVCLSILSLSFNSFRDHKNNHRMCLLNIKCQI